MSKKSANITIDVALDENNIPDKIDWSASDTDIKKENAEAIYLSFWNEKEKNTLKLDLWTKEMPVDSMKKFVLQNMSLLADYYQKATSDEENFQKIKKSIDQLHKEIL